jgi:L-iditol 2-dehydrogenase
MPTLTPPLPRTMTVAACTPGGGVRLESSPLPEPGPGELRLRLRGAGLCGTDLFKLRYGTAAEGMVLGHEVVGTVEALGPGTVGFLPGDRVVVPHHVACGECDLCLRGSETLCPVFRENLLVPGGFAEHILVRERAVRLAAFSLPPHLSDESAVFLEPAACVLRGLRHARLEETALPTAPEGRAPVAAVLGGGSMGLLHLLVARALFPDLRVVISDPLPERRALALRLGADAAAAPGEEVRQAVAGLAGGAGHVGADVVFDTAGGARALDEALGLTREGGSVVLFAHASSDKGAEHETAGFDLNTFFKGERRLLATYSSSLADQRDIYRLLVSGRLDPSPLVTHRLPLSRFGEAVALARDQQALKVLLVPEETP